MAANEAQRVRREAWEALDLLLEGLGNLLPPGSLPSKEEINRRYGPTFAGYAQAIVEAIRQTRAG